MNAPANTARSASPADDVSALAWVNDELRRSLETAHKALRRYLKEADAIGGSDVDTVDPSVLRAARIQIHQSAGALELVGLTAVAEVLRASEAVVQRMASKPQMVDAAAVETIERVSFAVLDYVTRQPAGKPVSPVMLFPQYRAAQQLAGADRVHPADLWTHDFQWRELPADPAALPRAADDAARSAMEGLVLALMRQPDPASVARMSDLCAELGAGAGSAHLRTLWQLASSVFEALSQGLLVSDVYVKRLASRLLAQLRMTVKGQDEASDRLVQDLLFFCAHAAAADAQRPAPRLAATLAAWGLEPAAAGGGDYDTPRLGRFDPAQITLARKRVAAAKDNWSAVAGGDMHRASGLNEQFALVGDSVARLMPGGESLSESLTSAVAPVAATGQPPGAPLAMEIATAMLYVDASIEDGELDHPETPLRMRRLAKRIDDVRLGLDPQPLEGWMEELYRRVSDRQTMGSVVQELRATLSEVEKQLDQYFRTPAERQVLIPVPGQLQAMRGVLSVLGLDQASQAVVHMRDDIDALASTEVDPQRARQTGTFDRVADNLGTLGFLIDMLSVQPALAKSLFRFDAATGKLTAVMGQSERAERAERTAPFEPVTIAVRPEAEAPPAFADTEPPTTTVAVTPLPLPDLVRQVGEAALSPATSDPVLEKLIERLSQRALTAEQPGLARSAGDALERLRRAADDAQRQAVRSDLARTLAAFGKPVAELPPAPPPAPVPPPKPVVAGSTGLEDDAEMREIFIEEAREVMGEADEALERLADAPESAHDMTAVRRAFHTLKGSSRMVGLTEFGDAAWACEQLYNARLASAPRLDGPLRQFTHDALGYLGPWIDAIAEGRDGGHRAAAVAQAADALRLTGQLRPIPAPEAVAAVPAAEAAAPSPEEATTIAIVRAVEPPVPSTPAAPAAERPAEPAAEGAPAPLADAPALAAFAMPAPDVAQPVELLLPEVPELEDQEPALELRSEPAALPEAAFADLPLAFDESPPALAEAPVTGGGEPAEPSADLVLPDLATETSPPTRWDASASGETVDFDFDLDLPELADQPTITTTISLRERVPDLPSADELDLSFPASAAASLAGTETPDVDVSAALPDEPTLDLTLPALATEALPAAEAEGVDFAFDLEAEPAAPAEAPQRVEAAEPSSSVDGAAGASPTEPEPVPEPVPEEPVKVIGPLRISIPLFNIFLNEADEQSRRLVTELAEWGVEAARHPVGESAVALAHSLAGNSATVGYADLSALARALEHALARSHAVGRGRPGEAALFSDAAEEIRRLLHQFAAGFLRPAAPGLMERLAEHERLPESMAPVALVSEMPGVAVEVSDFLPLLPEAASAAPAPADAFDDEQDIDAADAIDHDLFPVFDEEAGELLPQLQSRLREWHERPHDRGAPSACMRTLHTFKGGARLAGAMRLGEMAHRLETAIEHLAARDEVHPVDIEPLLARSDRMVVALDTLRGKPVAPAPAVEAAIGPAPFAAPERPGEAGKPAPSPAPEEAAAQVAEPAPEGDASPVVAAVPEKPAASPVRPAADAAAGFSPAGEAAPRAAATAPVLRVPVPARPIDWQRFSPGAPGVVADAAAERAPAAGTAAVRVRAGLLDRLVSHAGEVSITRERIASDMKSLQGSLGELTESLERMRKQLRDIELQAETQIASRMELARAAGESFDPLEMDRFTRFQELTRFMAESVNDVATLQRSLQRTLQSTEDELAAQARLTRELQDDLLRTRMVEFESASERLYRTVRQAAKETGKQVRLDIVGGAIELDRGVLERMIGPFEHLLRNSVVHGIEPPAVREQAGKESSGRVVIQVAQAGNEVAVEFGDDGGGFDYARIRERAVQRGLLPADRPVEDAELAQLVFAPGFSTAETVSELAGRGVGLDVVRAEVNAMGGRIETVSARGQGTRFRLLLPLTTAVTQVVHLRCGEFQISVPSTLVEVVKRVPRAETEAAYAAGQWDFNGELVPFFWLAALLQAGSRGDTSARSQTLVVIRSAAQRVAIHVDEVVGNQEVVVKNVGPQLARLPGLVGVTLLPSGAVALIYNPVALATVFAEGARQRMLEPARPVGDTPEPVAAEAVAPMVLVVDDSLTVRRVTQRLLVREGYRVVTAKDGMEALERLAEEKPAILLSDIEMPRMDGFDLVRNLRADPRLADLPVVMITSRIAQKHRDYAAELGVDHYLGKPYAEDELLSLVARYARSEALI